MGGVAESQEKDTWLWQSSRKSFQDHLEAPGGSSSLESRWGRGTLGPNPLSLPRAQMLVTLTSMVLDRGKRPICHLLPTQVTLGESLPPLHFPVSLPDGGQLPHSYGR